jgi:uric acid transporter
LHADIPGRTGDQRLGRFPMGEPVHPVDEVLPLPKLLALGLQHVLVMYANAVAVPLIIGGALHLPKDQMAMLINADLFAC